METMAYLPMLFTFGDVISVVKKEKVLTDQALMGVNGMDINGPVCQE